MSKVYVLLNVYDEAPNIPIAVNSVLTHITGREVIPVFVDGKYPDYEGEHDLSTDGTRDLAAQLGVLTDCIDYECAKRTHGLRVIDTMAEPGDHILYLDADEEITGMFGWPSDIGIIAFNREHGNVVYDRARLYPWEPDLEFKRRHYELWKGDEFIADLGTAGPTRRADVVGLGIHHNQAHDPVRFARKRAYYRDHLSPREKAHETV